MFVTGRDGPAGGGFAVRVAVGGGVPIDKIVVEVIRGDDHVRGIGAERGGRGRREHEIFGRVYTGSEIGDFHARPGAAVERHRAGGVLGTRTTVKGDAGQGVAGGMGAGGKSLGLLWHEGRIVLSLAKIG